MVGCRKAPCGGKGMVVDERPLEGILAEVIGPEGGVMCRPGEDDGKYMATNRRYELARKNPDQTMAAWDAHLQARGWEVVTPLDVLAANVESAVRDEEECGIVDQYYAKPGEPARVHVTVSFCVDTGWSSVTAFPCDGDRLDLECGYGGS
ncbi:hypothetical protein ENSA7_41200 [Enhygromyxa salina]|uniref:Uncharacterized protein n=2 Tax=Enhygromyxa salina TaxID=215803 RepID=A0A2S9YM99_9BACT|nr:hypothetical protein ENSA7_41200 [Enhygromyxa salina]